VAALSIPTHTATVRIGPFQSLDDPSTPAGLPGSGLYGECFGGTLRGQNTREMAYGASLPPFRHGWRHTSSVSDGALDPNTQRRVIKHRSTPLLFCQAFEGVRQELLPACRKRRVVANPPLPPPARYIVSSVRWRCVSFRGPSLYLDLPSETNPTAGLLHG